MLLINFLIFAFGLIFGSFLNVIIFRLPLNLSVLHPRSFCPSCSTTIPFYRNIPLLTYILQKGSCHNCKGIIHIQYPAIELLIGLLSVFSFNYFLFPEYLFFIIISGMLIAISLIDLRYFIIPLSLSITSLLLIILKISFSSNIIYHIYGMIIGLGYLSLIFIFTWIFTKKQPLGFGDLQLILILGLWLGPMKVLVAIFLSATFGIIYWIYLTTKNGYTKNIKLPYGTFLSITSIIVYIIPLNWDLFIYF